LAVTDEAHDLLDEGLLVEEAPPLRVALRPQLPRRLARVPERGVVLLVLLPRVGGPLLGVLLPPTPTPSHGDLSVGSRPIELHHDEELAAHLCLLLGQTVV
jgi:hypothetical protein